jgi:hypothetical protein
MRVYMYQAALYCGPCGRAIRDRLDTKGKAPEDTDDESSYDSDEYPKGPYPDGGGESDSPQHCDSGAECLDALDMGGDFGKVGAWLENDLTADGVQHVADSIEEKPDNPVCAFWAKVYADVL